MFNIFKKKEYIEVSKNDLKEIKEEIKYLREEKSFFEDMSNVRGSFLYYLGDYLHNFGTANFYWAKGEEKKETEHLNKKDAEYVGYIFLMIRYLMSDNSRINGASDLDYGEKHNGLRMISEKAAMEAFHNIELQEKGRTKILKQYELVSRILVNEISLVRALIHGEKMYVEEIYVENIEQLDSRDYMMSEGEYRQRRQPSNTYLDSILDSYN